MKEEGNAVVYCEGSFDSSYGKTAHGLVRFTERYKVVAVIDSSLAGKDAGMVLDGSPNGIPIVASLDEAAEAAAGKDLTLTHFVIGIATDGGYLTDEIREAVMEALQSGLNADSGLHDFLCDDPDLTEAAAARGLAVRDIRKPQANSNHMFSGKIGEVQAVKTAILGTDSAVGKRTTAWILTHELQKHGFSAEFIGTGQTAWLQGSRYGIVMDSLLNDYVSGELEHIVWKAWRDKRMDFAVIEGQGSLMNPGYPGGFEILAACRPDCIIMQHAPARKEYDGFPGYPVDSLTDQIFLAEFLSKKPVIGVTVNDEGLPPKELDDVCRELSTQTGKTVLAPLRHGVEPLVSRLVKIRHENKTS